MLVVWWGLEKVVIFGWYVLVNIGGNWRVGVYII